MAAHTVLAVDLGAESGRVMAVAFDGNSLQVEELHRFSNTPVTVRGALYWNLLELWRQIEAGVVKGQDRQPASLGVDAWGVDFALLDAQGALIGNPLHYRDARTTGMMEAVFARVSRAEVFAQTGIQFMPINTLYQMMSLVKQRSPQLDNPYMGPRMAACGSESDWHAPTAGAATAGLDAFRRPFRS